MQGGTQAIHSFPSKKYFSKQTIYNRYKKYILNFYNIFLQTQLVLTPIHTEQGGSA